MKRITLTMMFVATATVVGAQVPPTPPARPVTPVEPRPAPTPRAPLAPLPPRWADEMRLYSDDWARLGRDMALIDREHMAEMAREAGRYASEHSREIADAAREASRYAAEHSREIADAAREASRFSSEQAREIAEQAREQARWARENFNYDFNFNHNLDFNIRPTPMPALAPMASMAPMPRLSFGYANENFQAPRPVLNQGAPEDSVYSLAHDLLGRGEYGRAAAMFKDIAQKYPTSIYKDDLAYYEAFSRFRIGTTGELETAAKILEPRASKLIGVVNPSDRTAYTGFNRRRGTSDSDVAGLYTRINSTLAQRGNQAAAAIVAKAAQGGSKPCDRDDISLRAEALNALNQMDPAGTLPQLKRVLESKDECAIQLRKSAVLILAKRGDAEAASLLGNTAKSDPSPDVRADAISWLPKLQGDAGVTFLEEVLRTEQDERIQKSVVRTLINSENQRARASMRTLIDRKDASLQLRVEAVSSFNSERATTDDAAWLRSFYGRADNEQLKRAAVDAVGRIGGQENDQWLLALARNTNEPSQFRGIAIGRLMRSNTISIADLSKLYDASDALEIRQRIVSALESRRETEASDKLYDIFKNSTVPSIRSQAINALIRRKDPRSIQLLQNIP